MSSFFVCKPCHPSDPTTDTVRIGAPTVEEPEQEAARQAAAEQEEAERRWEEEKEEIRLMAEEEARLRAQQAEEEARLRAQWAEEEEELQRRQQQEREEAEAQRLIQEAERLQRETAQRAAQEEKEQAALRQQRVERFLKEHRFKGVATKKRSMLRTTYPIHCAAEKGDAELVEMLIQEGADPRQKNSAGKTPTQVAQKKDKQGSHASVVQVLGQVASMGGA